MFQNFLYVFHKKKHSFAFYAVFSIFLHFKIETGCAVLPTARHPFNISLKGAVLLPGRGDWFTNSLHASAYDSEYKAAARGVAQ